jgi:hypothetical protein
MQARFQATEDITALVAARGLLADTYTCKPFHTTSSTICPQTQTMQAMPGVGSIGQWTDLQKPSRPLTDRNYSAVSGHNADAGAETGGSVKSF